MWRLVWKLRVLDVRMTLQSNQGYPYRIKISSRLLQYWFLKIIRFNKPFFKRRTKYSKWNSICPNIDWTNANHASGTWEFDRFPWTVFQRSSDFKLFLFFSLHYQLFEKNQNTKKTLSILMGLKGGDCIRKAEVKLEHLMWEFFAWEFFFLQVGKLSNSNVPVVWINRNSLNISFFIWKADYWNK